MIFDELLEKNYNNDHEKYHNNNYIKIKISIDSYFLNVYKGNNYQDHLKCKFFYAKNILLHKYIEPEFKAGFLDLFNKTQKQYMGLLKLKGLWKYRRAKEYDVYTDLNCTDLCDIKDKYKITILDNDRKFTFTYYDLIKIINNALSFSEDFYITPIQIKNPYNNICFSDANLYNIYISILESSMKMPILLERFFNVQFNIKEFHLKNDYLIREHIINNCARMDSLELGDYILKMIDTFNKSKLYEQSKLIIDNCFPFKTLINDMLPFVKMFLQSEFSVDRHVRYIYKKRYIKELTKFKKRNYLYGRKMISKNIQNMYYISCLYHNHNIKHWQEFAEYTVLPPHMINVKKKFYFVPINQPDKYSIFYYYDNNKRNEVNNHNIHETFTLCSNNPFYSPVEIDIINKVIKPNIHNNENEYKSIYDVLLFNNYFNNSHDEDSDDEDSDDEDIYVSSPQDNLEDISGSNQVIINTRGEDTVDPSMNNNITTTRIPIDTDTDTDTDCVTSHLCNDYIDSSSNAIGVCSDNEMYGLHNNINYRIWNDMSNNIGDRYLTSFTINNAVIYPTDFTYTHAITIQSGENNNEVNEIDNENIYLEQEMQEGLERMMLDEDDEDDDEIEEREEDYDF